ncbi:hypothetical protein BD560DRAFT_404591 [Blakeslea trispora]|nr:hypothetical protein BD560DRAFT_404591 [Blakeslea trispora]
MNNNNKDLTYETGLSQNVDTGYVNYEDVKQSGPNNTESPKMSINPKQHAPVMTGQDDANLNQHRNSKDDPEQIKQATVADESKKQSKKPLNTGGDAHHIAEQPAHGLGGLTGEQPVGEVNFKKL